MDFAGIAISKRTVTLVMTMVLLGAGFQSFNGMSRLEDPEFTIKTGLVVTPYFGASAEEVEQEVTDELEQAVQKMGQVDDIQSRSERGLSTLTVNIKAKYNKDSLPQVWDELRRKVGDAQGNLPPGAGPSIVVDDFGDVYGIFVALYTDEYSYAELKRTVDYLRRELLLVQDVAKIETYGERQECVYVELDRDRMAQLGIPAAVIIDELQKKNVATMAGRVQVGAEYITISPTGESDSVDDIANTIISTGLSEQLRLRDVADVRRGYLEPQGTRLRYDGKMAIGLGISTVAGGNVVTMGEAMQVRLAELKSEIPLGIEFGQISVQSTAVVQSIKGFTSSLLQAVAIVVIVLLFFMGLRSGLLIGFILMVTIAGSFIFLQPWGVALERISLGALIIALGMLVDNAIVVVDGMLMKLEEGVDAKKAASEVVQQSAMPLLGATLIAILAFAAIGTSQDSTGEFCRSLFQVVFVSLLLSWVTAVTVTPVLCVMFLKVPEKKEGGGDAYDSSFYRAYKGLLRVAIGKRWLSMAFVGIAFVTSLWGFGFVEQSFFPPSTRPQFMVDFWLPQGTHPDETAARCAEVETWLAEQEGVTHVTSLIGQGGLRFLLTYSAERPNSGYAQFLVDVDDADRMETLPRAVELYMAERYPSALTYASPFQLGPGSTGKVQARFSGPDSAVLRRLAGEAQAIMAADPDSKSLRTDWRQRVKVIRPVLAEEQANLAGIQRTDVAAALLQGFQGARVGVFREGDLLLPIVMRAPDEERDDVTNIQNLQIWSPAAGKMIPLRQVVSDFRTDYEDELIMRLDRRRTIIAYADPIAGPASKLFARVRPTIEALELPPGYTLEWGGEYEDSGEAQAGLAASLPMFVGMMILISIVLFNNLRQPTIIWLCVPLALIGVTVGLLSTGQPFGFMALLGFLSLMGMLIKNAIVLIDQINLELSEGKELLDAIIDSGASRLRPVAMAALTTALGMIPLLMDAFFKAMAVTIIFGLMVATVLTMVVVPVLYAIFYRARNPDKAA